MGGDKVVKIENLEFVNKNKFSWKDLEKKLYDFLDLELIVNNKIVYFDNHAIDEMSSSKYNFKLKGKMKLIKANICMYIKELLLNAYSGRHQNDVNAKHGNMASRGFDRYTCEFEYPNKDAMGNIVEYTKYTATIIIRCASDGKDYLYDIIDIKK